MIACNRNSLAGSKRIPGSTGRNMMAACQPHQMKGKRVPRLLYAPGRIQQQSRCRVPKESRSVLFKANLQLRSSPNPTNLPPYRALVENHGHISAGCRLGGTCAKTLSARNTQICPKYVAVRDNNNAEASRQGLIVAGCRHRIDEMRCVELLLQGWVQLLHLELVRQSESFLMINMKAT